MDSVSPRRFSWKEARYGTLLCPMAGVTDAPFRLLVRELCGGRLGAVVSEFIATDGCEARLLPTRAQAKFHPEERPFGIQIFGKDPLKMAAAAEVLAELSPDFIEVNAGCPVPKVAGKGGGAGLLKDLPRLGKILREVRSRISLPLSLKCRLGWDSESINVLETLELAQNEGVEWLTVHGRTRVQGYNGLADWDAIGEVAARAKIPVIGNGDIVSAVGAAHAMKTYGVAGVGIGRGAMHNPWLFGQVADLLEGKAVSRIGAWEAAQAFGKFYQKMLACGFKPEGSLGRLKQMAARLCNGFKPANPEFRRGLLTSQTAEEFLARAEEFMATEAGNYEFEPERLRNLNGEKSGEVVFGNQFK